MRGGAKTALPFMVAAGIALGASPCRAHGEDTADRRPPSFGAAGVLVPREPTDVELLAERTELTFEGYGDSWRLSANYTIRNRGKLNAPLAVGVPMRWAGKQFAETGTLEPLPEAKEPIREGASTIRLHVNDSESGCSVRFVERVTPGGDVLGWCDFSVVIPQGDAVSLSLTYRGGSTFQEGGEFSRISVSLAHGAPWDKPVGRVDLGIQLSKWARRNVKVVSPASRVLRFERLTWSGNDVTPGSFGPVVIDYGMDDRWPGAGWVRRAVDVRARTGAPQDPGTASPVTTGRADEWCVRRRDAEGRYELEVTMSAAALPGLDCKVLDVEVTPGPGSPAPNRLLERARFEGCSSPGSGFDFDLTGSRSGGWPPPTRPGDRIGAASEVAVPPGSPLRDELACVRLAGHLSGTEPGSEEVCIGGLRPRVYCRAEGRPQKPAAGVRSTRPHVPACWTPLVKACAARINERLSDVLQARPGAWPHLQETCRECAQPWQGVADPLAWKRCEVAVGLRSVGGALDLTRLASELRHRLTEAQEDLQVTLLCLDEASCPP